MAILVVRHAKAGDRSRWEGPDEPRPVTKAGRAQAEALVEVLAGFDVERVLSSPYLRCVQTVEPLAAARGLTVERRDELAEGAGQPARELVRRLAAETSRDVVACTHGDVVYDVVGPHVGGGAVAAAMKKGSTWVLETANGQVVGARHLEPPRGVRDS